MLSSQNRDVMGKIARVNCILADTRDLGIRQYGYLVAGLLLKIVIVACENVVRELVCSIYLWLA